MSILYFSFIMRKEKWTEEEDFVLKKTMDKLFPITNWAIIERAVRREGVQKDVKQIKMR